MDRYEEWGSYAGVALRVALHWDRPEELCAVRMNFVPGHVDEYNGAAVLSLY